MLRTEYHKTTYNVRSIQSTRCRPKPRHLHYIPISSTYPVRLYSILSMAGLTCAPTTALQYHANTLNEAPFFTSWQPGRRVAIVRDCPTCTPYLNRSDEIRCLENANAIHTCRLSVQQHCTVSCKILCGPEHNAIEQHHARNRIRIRFTLRRIL